MVLLDLLVDGVLPAFEDIEGGERLAETRCIFSFFDVGGAVAVLPMVLLDPLVDGVLPAFEDIEGGERLAETRCVSYYH
ncbi:hypothetical protein L2E82_14617 [Cichorium intybus]|uniref:Uncharacterized protein n=1 Tax=Cichorium intybus TaxID=13427 RepID=A0ACB9F1N0_CICIN|nr:hypothetical protein L2E82_14617 [Cichorium intybus]